MVVHTTMVLARDGESSVIEFDTNGSRIKVILEFLASKAQQSDAVQPGIVVGPEGDAAKITLSNWAGPLPTVTNSPVPLGKLANGQTLQVMLWHTYTGPIHRMDLQFALEPLK